MRLPTIGALVLLAGAVTTPAATGQATPNDLYPTTPALPEMASGSAERQLERQRR